MYSLEEVERKTDSYAAAGALHDPVSYFYWRGWEEALGGRPVLIQWSHHTGTSQEKEEYVAYEMGKADARGALDGQS